MKIFKSFCPFGLELESLLLLLHFDGLLLKDIFIICSKDLRNWDPLFVKGQVQSVNTGEDTLVLREATGAGGHQVTVDSLSSSPGGCGWLRPGQYVQVQWCKYSLNIFPLSKYFPCPGGGPIGGRGQAEVQQDNQLDPGQTLSADVGPRGRGVAQCPHGENYYQWYLDISDKQSLII